MSRLRATLSSLPLDREIAEHVNSAQRSILAALRLCEAEGVDPGRRRRARAVRRDLEKVLGAMRDVRRIRAPYDQDDSDLKDTPTLPRPKREVPTPPSPPEIDGE